MKILLMGPPACGKGTVGQLLSEKIGLPIFSVGGLLRDIPKESIFYEPLHEKMDKGVLAPNSVTAGIIRDELKDEKYKNGFILDGWMRDLEQRDYFDPSPDIVIFINISEETSIKRISGRRFCGNDDFTCNIYTLPPKNDEKCDICNAPLLQRDDDKEEVVKTRLALYRNETLPVVNTYKQEGIIIEVDGEGPPSQVLQFILDKLSQRDKH